jgi:hypothetical protein
MDPAGIGALIGISMLLGGFLFHYFCDQYSKRKQISKKVSKTISTKTEATPILVRNPSHKKLSELLPPKPLLS